MVEQREQTLALLSMAALAVDFLFVIFLSSALINLVFPMIAGMVDGITPTLVRLVLVPVALVVYFGVCEIVLGGFTIGRFCIGLKVTTSAPGNLVPLQIRIKRFLSALLTLGLRSVRFTSLPSYSKSALWYFDSEWTGSIVSGSAPPVRRSPQASPGQQAARAETLEVVGGPCKGKSVRLSNAMDKRGNGVLRIGRDPRKVHLVLAADQHVSRIHCRIAGKNGSLVVLDGEAADKPSTHGTIVGHYRVKTDQPVALMPGQTISIGNSLIRLV